MRRVATLAATLALVCAACGPAALAGGAAVVVRDQSALRAAPRDSAREQAALWQGEIVEVRAERLDYLQVYDYRRERGGFVRASQVRRLVTGPDAAPELLSILRFLREAPGAETLGIGLAMAYAQAAPAEVLQGPAGAEALDALGGFADRLAQRASSGAEPSKAHEAKIAAHLDVATRYGLRFATYERAGRMQVCYDGDAFGRVLALPSTPPQRARAALALTRPECVDPDLGPAARAARDEWRADVLGQVDAAALPGFLANRVLMRRASVWAGIAFQRARSGAAAEAAARRALVEIAGVRRAELTDDDWPEYNNAAMRVSASRWAASPAAVSPAARPLHLVLEPGAPGETCVVLIDAKYAARGPLVRRCTYGIVWPASATTNRESNALAVAVQSTESWLELWVVHKEGKAWTVRVLPPAAMTPDLGYAEFAGWVPGGTQMLVAREARSEGKYRRSFDVVRLDTLAVARQATDPAALGPFQRWQDPAWKVATLSVR
jgi:hypothetical protein